MKTIIAPTTANSDFVNGLFYSNGQFCNRYKDPVSDKWACYLVWSKHNSLHGDTVANAKLEEFRKKYGITNK